jgi:hypothetical protein
VSQLHFIRTRPLLLYIAVCVGICALSALPPSRFRPVADGVAATAYQASLAVIAPTYVAANHIGMFFSRARLPQQPGTIEQWSAYNQSVRAVFWFAFSLLTAAELWPLLLLCFRRWASLSRSTRAAVIVYSSTLVAAFIAAFVYVRLYWSVILD